MTATASPDFDFLSRRCVQGKHWAADITARLLFDEPRTSPRCTMKESYTAKAVGSALIVGGAKARVLCLDARTAKRTG